MAPISLKRSHITRIAPTMTPITIPPTMPLSSPECIVPPVWLGSFGSYPTEAPGTSCGPLPQWRAPAKTLRASLRIAAGRVVVSEVTQVSGRAANGTQSSHLFFGSGGHTFTQTQTASEPSVELYTDT